MSDTAKQVLEPGEEVELTVRMKSMARAATAVDPNAGEIEEINVKGQRAPREVTKRTLEQRELSRIPGSGKRGLTN